MASARLQRHLKTKHDMAIQNWKERRKSAALAVGLNKIILLLGLSRTREVLSLVIAPMFKNSKIFGKVSLVKILLIFPPFGIYMKWISQWPIGLLNCPLFTINCAQILTGARKVAKKAGGPERLSGKMIALLPQEAHIRAAEMLNLFERRGMWPQQLIHWKVVFLPKKRSEAAASLGDTRPICIGPSLYRLWTSLRLEQLKSWLASYLDKFQAGGVGGPDVPSLLLTLNLDKHPEAFPVGLCLCLDYAKAFDSSDIDLIINIYILNRLKAPHRVVRLLADQWRRHRRWVTLAGCVAETPPLVNTIGLPQGDPFSPVALALCLLLPLRQQKRLHPMATTLLNLDDRTIVAPDAATLRDAAQCWEQLSQVTRMKTKINRRHRCGLATSLGLWIFEPFIPILSFKLKS
jgi:hypothetical protein